MVTEILDYKTGISKAKTLLKNGDIVAFSTETVYGLGANALNSEAIKKIFKVKGRPQDNPLIVHLSTQLEIKKYAKITNKDAYPLIDNFMPGPLTLILKKKDLIPDIATAKLDTVAIRIPEDEGARKLISTCGFPIVAPSANKSTRISPTTAKHVFDDFNGEIPLILDNGPSLIGLESTVLDLSGDNIKILRHGAVTIEMIEDAVGHKILTNETLKNTVCRSPGMKYKHYAPKIDLFLSDSIDGCISKYNELKSLGINPVVLVHKKTQRLEKVESIYLGKDNVEIAKNIYSTLHYCQHNYDAIICKTIDGDDIALAIMDRLNKASNK